MATTSCTAALHLALLALGVNEEDEVIVPAFTWVTSAHAVEYVNAKPVFVDIDLDSFNISVSNLRNVITKRTKAIIVVHLFGKSAYMHPIIQIAKEFNLKIIEDAACAIGTRFEGKLVGNFGDVGCFSFHPRKIISTGEGGMLTTNNSEVARALSILRNHGATPSEFSETDAPKMANFDHIGFNLRMSDITAAVGVAQMSKLPALLKDRREKALAYSEKLVDLDSVQIPTDDPGHTYQSYVLLVRGSVQSTRDDLMRHLGHLGIQTRPGTHSVPHLGFYKTKYGYSEDEFRNSLTAAQMSITLPLSPSLDVEGQERVIRAIKNWKPKIPNKT